MLVLNKNPRNPHVSPDGVISPHSSSWSACFVGNSVRPALIHASETQLSRGTLSAESGVTPDRKSQPMQNSLPSGSCMTT
jgi:hypothetical protein